MRQSPVGTPSRRSGCHTNTSASASAVRSKRSAPVSITGSCTAGSSGSSTEVMRSSGTPSVPWTTSPFLTTAKASSSVSETSRIGR